MPVQTKLQVRRDTAANWTSTNPTLASGEIGFETDTLKFKIGNGSTAWNSLAYQGASGSGTVTSITAASPLTGGTITTTGTIGINASSTSTANYVVQRDASGNFSANTITANLTGTASSATVAASANSVAIANVANLGTNVATFLTTPNTLNLLNAVTGETGSGALVFGTSPTLTTPNIGAATGTSLNVTGQLISTQASGTAPFAVSSNTVVTNLNADLLDGYSANEGAVASTVVARSSSGAISANVIFGTTIDASQTLSAAQGVVVGSEGASAQPVVSLGRTDSAASTPTINFNSGATTTTYDAKVEVTGGNGTNGKGTLTITAGNVNVTSQIRSTFAGAPFAVSNTTVVTNLNADLLDGYHHATAATANTVVARDTNGSFSANVITASLAGRATNANAIVGGGAGQLPYQNAANTTTFLAAPATNNSFLSYNTATSAPEWDTPPQTMAVLTGYTSTVTAAGSTTLTNTSTYYQYFTGTSVQTVILPVTSTLQTGWTFHIVNNSTGNITVNSSGGNLVIVIIPGTTAMVTCIGTTLTTAADWEAGLTDFSAYTGTGSVVMNTSPTLTTPNIGAATGTSLNVTGGLFSTADSNIGGTTTTNVRIMTRRVWISNTAPTGTNTTGDVWISW